jgi:predicted Zn-dependent protease
VRASELRWKRDPARADGRVALLAQIDGLPLGPRPDGGVFRGDWFLQPAMNFQVRFPSRWKTSNTNAMVGASSPTGSAIVVLTAAPPTATGREAADQWLAEAQKDQKITVVESKPASSGTISTWRLLVESRDRRGSLSSYVTAIPYGPATFMVTGMAPSRVAKQELPRTLEVARSFGPLSAEARASIKGTTLDVVKAQAGETPFAIASRTGSSWSGAEVAAYNGVGEDRRFETGDLVKVARESAYRAKER